MECAIRLVIKKKKQRRDEGEGIQAARGRGWMWNERGREWKKSELFLVLLTAADSVQEAAFRFKYMVRSKIQILFSFFLFFSPTYSVITVLGNDDCFTGLQLSNSQCWKWPLWLKQQKVIHSLFLHTDTQSLPGLLCFVFLSAIILSKILSCVRAQLLQGCTILSFSVLIEHVLNSSSAVHVFICMKQHSEGQSRQLTDCRTVFIPPPPH